MTSFAYYLEEDVITGLLLSLLGGVPSGLLGIVSYVLTSMALYTIAQRREIQKAWLAWIPVFNCWILGSLSDQYRYVVKGQVKSKRKWLLWMNLLNLVLGLISTIWTVGIVINAISFGEFAAPIFQSLLRVFLLVGPMAILGIAITVFRFMALYDVYMSLDPNNAVLFLVLSILVGIVEPFFLFFNREKDTGMPPRRTISQDPPVWEPEHKDYL